MSPQELVNAVEAAGVKVQVQNGVPSLRGELAPELLAAIRADRQAFLDAWEDRRRSRYWKAPPDSLPLRRVPPSWRPEVWRRVERHVRQQSDAVLEWLGRRMIEYSNAGMSAQGSAKSACLDVLAWQMERHPDPVAVISAFDESLLP